MDNQEIITESPLKQDVKESNDSNNLLLILAYAAVALLIGYVSGYYFGYKDAENKYKSIDPKINLFITPSNEPSTVIPVTLTKNGVGIKFQNALTNIIAIGLEEVNKRN